MMNRVRDSTPVRIGCALLMAWLIGVFTFVMFYGPGDQIPTLWGAFLSVRRYIFWLGLITLLVGFINVRRKRPHLHSNLQRPGANYPDSK
jgi:hypothetical protein